MNPVLELIINRRNELFYALDDARNDVPISENECYESDEYYETAIATLNELIKEIEESDALRTVESKAFAQGVRHALIYVTYELGLDVADCDLADEYGIECDDCGESVLYLQEHKKQLCEGSNDDNANPDNHFVAPATRFAGQITIKEVNSIESK